MDLNVFAQQVYQSAYADEMRKMAQVNAPEADSWVPLLAALGVAPFLAQKGSVAGRKAGLGAAPAVDWLMAKNKPTMTIADYLKNTVGARAGLAHAGTVGGALAGAGGAALLYKYLKDNF